MFKKIREISKRVQELYTRYERRFTSGALLAGFIIDSLTLKRIDLAFEQIILFSHLAVVAASIAFINAYEGGAIRGRAVAFLRAWAPLVMQFSFGALFSGFFIFYSRSASLAASWPFLLFLAGLLIGNEFFRARYQRLVFQISIFYFALFSFSIFYVPIVVGALGVWVFVASGIVSIALIALFVRALSLVIPQRIQENKPFIAASIAGIFISINALYFLNIIPPIPLALKTAEPAHAVELRGGEYRITEEQQPWYAFLMPREILHVRAGESIAFYSSVFAPTDLTTSIVHEWQYYDEERDRWISDARIGFPIVGGRDGGYRGYSVKTRMFPGTWRVAIKTEEGQLLGRTRFMVKPADEPLELMVKTGI